jgi:hypothetical protein
MSGRGIGLLNVTCSTSADCIVAVARGSFALSPGCWPGRECAFAVSPPRICARSSTRPDVNLSISDWDIFVPDMELYVWA